MSDQTPKDIQSTDMSPCSGSDPSPSVAGWPLRVLRLEGAALLGTASVLFATTGESWWLFAASFLAPDLAFIAYAAGPRRGAAAYNALHTTLLPLALAVAAWSAGWSVMLACAFVWLAHIGFDRMLGYGLKYGSGFGDTHLGR